MEEWGGSSARVQKGQGEEGSEKWKNGEGAVPGSEEAKGKRE